MSRFVLKRLHSLSGLVPLGAFLILHFFSSSYVFISETAFNEQVRSLGLLPLGFFLEIVFIFLPLLFHIFLGLVIVYRGENNFANYPFLNNWLYFLQRLTGIGALVFVMVHVYSTRFYFLTSNGSVTFQALRSTLNNSYWFWFYLVGILATTFHFSNGIRTTLMTWGITVGESVQTVTLTLSSLVFLGTSFWGVAILLKFI